MLDCDGCDIAGFELVNKVTKDWVHHLAQRVTSARNVGEQQWADTPEVVAYFLRGVRTRTAGQLSRDLLRSEQELADNELSLTDASSAVVCVTRQQSSTANAK